MNKELAVLRIQLWWKIISKCYKYFISDIKTEEDTEGIYEWKNHWEPCIEMPYSWEYPYKRDELLNFNESYTQFCCNCGINFMFAPDYLYRYYGRIRRLHNNYIMGSFCKECYKIPEQEQFNKTFEVRNKLFKCYKLYIDE